jgi:hypothetical protein
MPEGLQLPDGTPVDVDAANEAFTAAMAAPANGEAPEYPAPPRKPVAPFGYKADGTARQRRPGPGARRKEDAPRTAKTVPAAPAKGKSVPPGEARDYTATLAGAGQAVWMGMAAVPVPHVQAFAAVWAKQLDAQVGAWNQAAQQDARVAAMVQRLEGGPVWLVGIAIATAPLVGAAVAIARDGKIRDELAATTREDFGKFLQAAQPAEAEAEPEPAAA